MWCVYSDIRAVIVIHSHPAGQGRTRCTVRYDGKNVAEAWANSRKTAKNAAARVALQKLSEEEKHVQSF